MVKEPVKEPVKEVENKENKIQEVNTTEKMAQRETKPAIINNSLRKTIITTGKQQQTAER